MSPKQRRYFLMIMIAIAGLTLLGCLGIAVFTDGWRAGPDAALALGAAAGFLLVNAFAAATATERPIWRVPAWAGIALAAPSFLGFCGAFLLQILANYLPYPVWPCVFTIYSSACMLCLVAWVGSLRIKPLGKIVQLLSIASIIGLWGTCLWLLWDVQWLPEMAYRILMTLVLLAFGSTFLTFILYKFFGLKIPDPLTTFDQALFVRCPRCLTGQEIPVGPSHCRVCDLRFTIEVEEPRCPSCNYSLRGLTRPVCPECGRNFVLGEAMATAS